MCLSSCIEKSSSFIHSSSVSRSGFQWTQSLPQKWLSVRQKDTLDRTQVCYSAYTHSLACFWDKLKTHTDISTSHTDISTHTDYNMILGLNSAAHDQPNNYQLSVTSLNRNTTEFAWPTLKAENETYGSSSNCCIKAHKCLKCICTVYGIITLFLQGNKGLKPVSSWQCTKQSSRLMQKKSTELWPQPQSTLLG